MAWTIRPIPKGEPSLEERDVFAGPAAAGAIRPQSTPPRARTIFGPFGCRGRAACLPTRRPMQAPGAPLTSIRVLIGPMPQMLRAIIDELLSHEPDLVIVGS